jgi:hypothetical protein
MRLIVAGSRDVEDYELVSNTIHSFLAKENNGSLPDVVLSGTARGADRLGERWANDNGVSVKFYPADWGKYAKRAGYLRNQQMAENADALVAIWDGQSRGTMHMIHIAEKMGLKVYVCTIPPRQDV